MSAALIRQQTWLFDAITADQAPARLSRVLGGAAVPAAIGLEVYRHAYRARLRDCLADDFSAVQQVLGEAAFAVVADAYISELPPSASTLNRYGAAFPTWLQGAAKRLAVARRVYVGQLAHLEWALVEAIHAPLSPTVTRGALAKLAPEGWVAARLTPVPSLRLVRCTWSINAAYAAHLNARSLVPQRCPGAVVVVRRAAGLRRHQLGAVEARLLGALCAGVPLGRALAGIAPEQASTVQAAFAHWLASGFFSHISCPLLRRKSHVANRPL